MRRSKINKAKPGDDVKPHTLCFQKSLWKQLQAEAAEREMSISDILAEAYLTRLVNIAPKP